MLHPPEWHFSNTGFTSYNSNSVMQKSDVPVVTCVDCPPVEVVVWEELFALARGEIETGHETESKCKNGKKKRKKNRAKRMRNRRKKLETKIMILAAYLACLLVFSLVLQFEVAVQGHYGDTA